jgi:exportin-T
MRDNCVKELSDNWFEILNNSTTSIDISRDCLDNIKLYISWIDISLIANQKFVPLFFKFISIEETREKAAECIFEVSFHI